MKRRSWKVCVAGIAVVQLLVIGADVAVLWPTPCEADKAIVRIHEGMSFRSAKETVNALFFSIYWAKLGGDRRGWVCEFTFLDGSHFVAGLRAPSDFQGIVDDFYADRVFLVLPFLEIRPPTPARGSPVATLRRTLARVFPALEE
jgi:hypothetical protein